MYMLLYYIVCLDIDVTLIFLQTGMMLILFLRYPLHKEMYFNFLHNPTFSVVKAFSLVEEKERK